MHEGLFSVGLKWFWSADATKLQLGRLKQPWQLQSSKSMRFEHLEWEVQGVPHKIIFPTTPPL